MNKSRVNNLNIILEYLISLGNELGDDEIYLSGPHGGSVYRLKKNIDFESIKNQFCLSNNIVLNEENDSIFDKNEWNLLHGPGYNR